MSTFPKALEHWRTLCAALLLFVLLLTSTTFAADNTVLWTTQFGGTSASEEIAMGISTDDGMFVAGTTTGALPGETNAGGIDGWVRKYDRYGTLQWSRQFGTSGDDIVTGIAANNVAGVYVVGSTNGTFPGETNAGGMDIFATKYETDGTYSWSHQKGTAGTDELFDVDMYDTGAPRFVGRTDGSLGGDNAGGYDIIVGSIGGDQNLNVYQFGGAGNDTATGISYYTAGTPFVSGYTDGVLGDQSSSGGQDAFLMKLNSDFTMAWVRQFGTAADDRANAVALNDAYAIVGGETAGTLDGESTSGGVDAFAATYDDSGALQWLRQFGTAGDDRVTGAAGTAFLPVSLFAGETSGAFSGETNAGGTDIFAARFDIGGNRLWTDQQGTAGEDHVRDAEMDFGLQHLYPVGDTTGAFAGQSNTGGADAFAMKIVQDNDDDGMFNEVDVLPYDFSDTFLDEETAVDTQGDILDRGDVNLQIVDAADPADGVVAVALAAGEGTDPADVEFCSGIANTALDPGDAVSVTCGSATVGVVGGIVDTTFVSPEGLTTTTTYDVGNELRYDPSVSVFEAAPSNPDAITVNIGATDQIIGPGQTLKLVSSVADAFLREGHANQNEGANPMLILRKQGSTRPVVRFDLSAVSLVGLRKATLVLSIGSMPPAQWGNGRPIEVRRLTQAWTEGDGKDIDVPEAESTRGTGAGVTWHCAIDTDIADHNQDCSAPWSGGSMAARTAPTVMITNGMTGEIAFDVTQDVLNGAGNGWLLKKVNEESNGNIRFYARESASGDASLAPKLLLQYD